LTSTFLPLTSKKEHTNQTLCSNSRAT